MSKISQLTIRRAGSTRRRCRAEPDAGGLCAVDSVIGREPLPMKADYEKAVREHEIDLLYSDGQPVALVEVFLVADHLYVENMRSRPSTRARALDIIC